jgi:hypothetical protein
MKRLIPAARRGVRIEWELLKDNFAACGGNDENVYK